MIPSLRQALRSLRRSPGFVLTVVATLGLGIGLNTAIFTVVDCVLLRPLGYRDADRIVAIQSHLLDENRSIPKIGGDDYTDLSRQVRSFEATAFYQGWPDGIQINGASVYLPVANVSPGFGAVLGVQPVAGRLFQPGHADDHAALVSSSFAREHFGSARAALGQVIRYQGALRPIVGVLPEGFSFPATTAVWFDTPAPFTAARSSYSQQAVGKRRAGVSNRQLAAELDTFSRQLQKAFPEDRRKSLEAVPLQETLVGTIRPVLHLLMGSVLVILLIAWANITHLQLVRSMRLLRATGIRTALGASRSALAGRALLEAMLLAASGCVVALLLAGPALRLLIRLAPPEIPRLADIHLNLQVLFFSFAVSVALMALAAVFPVWLSWHVDPASVLRQETSRGTESRGSLRLRDGFVVAEVALTLTLSAGAILLTRQMLQESRQDLGFSPENLITLDSHVVDSAPAPTAQQMAAATPEQTQAYSIAQGKTRLSRLDATLDSLSSVPGVESVAAIDGAPMGFDGSDVGYAVKGRQVFAPPFENLPNADIRPVTPNFFATLGVPLLRGRMLSPEDRLDAPPVLLINQTLAQKIFPGQDPVGQQIMCGFDSEGVWWTIVGVVGDIRASSPGQPPSSTFYVPVAQHPAVAGDMQLMIRTRADAAGMVETLRKSLKQTHPEIAVKGATMREDIGETQRAEQFRTSLFGSFAAVSILLAAIGMYGVTAYSVTQRRYEFGLRFALGASRGQVLGMVLRKALAVALAGVFAGVLLTAGLLRVMAAMLGRLPAFDPAATLLAAIAVLCIALFATLLPARAAASVDPMTVLRSE